MPINADVGKWMPELERISSTHGLSMWDLDDYIKAAEYTVTHIVTDGGGSIKVLGGEVPTSGYMVSMAGHERTYPGVSMKDVVNYIIDHPILVTARDRYLGSWHNSEDGLVYLDVSWRFDREDEAVYWAKHFEQKAYFNLDTMTEIRLDKGE